MLNLRSLMMPSKQKKNLLQTPGPADQMTAPDQGALKQGALAQQQVLDDPEASFKKRLKQNSPINMSWLTTGTRTGSQPRGSGGVIPVTGYAPRGVR